MKKILHASLAALLLTLCWSSVHAYELATHGRMTYEAFKRSVLNPNPNDPNDPQFLKKILGIEKGGNPFGNIYYDITGDSIRERTSQPFEEDQAAGRMPPNTEPLSVEGWLLRGAIREDDYARAFGVWVAPNPQNDPDSPQAFWRVMNHFYDPVNRAPL